LQRIISVIEKLIALLSHPFIQIYREKCPNVLREHFTVERQGFKSEDLTSDFEGNLR